MTQRQRYTFATWNIDQARREESHENTRFDVRWPFILANIASAKPDILCLQELRNLETSAITVPRLLFEVSQLGYDYTHAYYGPDGIAFAQAIFFRREKFFPVSMRLHLLPLADETKPTLSRILLGLQLRCAVSEKLLTVYSTHFGLEEAEKMASAEWMCGYLDCYPEAYLCAGDYNFFDDRDGALHRQRMLTNGREDLAYPLANASGTFMGFEHDEFKQPYEKMSRLDHVFAKGVQYVSNAIAWGDMESVRRREYPSDHLMIVLDFEL